MLNRTFSRNRHMSQTPQDMSKLFNHSFQSPFTQFNPYHNPIPALNSKALAYQALGTPYTQCPQCGQEPILFKDSPFLTCKAHHVFYKCPTCGDTRISNRREEVYFCGLQHSYHICPHHRTPVQGISRITGNCTCPKDKDHTKRSTIFNQHPSSSREPENYLGKPFLD